RLCPRRNNWTSKAGWRCKHWLKMQSSFAPQLCGGSCNSFCARSSGCRWCAMAVLLLRWGTSNAAASSVTCRITLWNVSAADSGGCVPSHFWVITDGPKWHTPSAIVLIHAVGRRCNQEYPEISAAVWTMARKDTIRWLAEKFWRWDVVVLGSTLIYGFGVGAMY